MDTRTRGIDVVLHNRFAIGEKSRLNVTAAANFTETKVTTINIPSTLVGDAGLQATFFDRQQRGRLENAQPHSKIILSANYTIGKLGLDVRTVRFGEVTYCDARLDPVPTDANPNPFLFSSIDQTFSAKWVTDATINFQIIKNLGCRLEQTTCSMCTPTNTGSIRATTPTTYPREQQVTCRALTTRTAAGRSTTLTSLASTGASTLFV